MSSFRILKSGFSNLITSKSIFPFKKKPVTIRFGYCLTNTASYRKAYPATLRAYKMRREIAGPDRVRRRNEWYQWNNKAELYAFSRRLYENISEDTLQCAFVHESYLEKEEQQRKELDIPSQDVQLDLKSNVSLIAVGDKVIRDYLERYLSYCFQLLPREGIDAIRTFLMSEEILSHISYNLGTSELILCAEYPPEPPTLAATMKALVGSIATDDSTARAENFVLDFVCPQLIGKEVFELWDLENPLEVLDTILEKHGHARTEPRLIFESGRNTIESIYHVGIYSNKQFLGRGPGETLDIAVEIAAYNVLKKLFDIEDAAKPLHFGDKARTIDFSTVDKRPFLSEWHSESLKINTLE